MKGEYLEPLIEDIKDILKIDAILIRGDQKATAIVFLSV
jgi:hypothetical protein